MFEVKANQIIRRGRITTELGRAAQRLDTTYRNQDFRRELIVQAERAAARAGSPTAGISFEVALDPGAAWHACLLYDLVDGDVITSRAARRLHRPAADAHSPPHARELAGGQC